METEVLDVKNFINSPIWHYDKAFKPLLNSFLDTKTWKVVGSTSHENFKEFPSSSQGGTMIKLLNHYSIVSLTQRLGKWLEVLLMKILRNFHHLVKVEQTQ